jgi:hypothetical protein
VHSLPNPRTNQCGYIQSSVSLVCGLLLGTHDASLTQGHAQCDAGVLHHTRRPACAHSPWRREGRRWRKSLVRFEFRCGSASARTRTKQCHTIQTRIDSGILNRPTPRSTGPTQNRARLPSSEAYTALASSTGSGVLRSPRFLYKRAPLPVLQPEEGQVPYDHATSPRWDGCRFVEPDRGSSSPSGWLAAMVDR